MKIDWKQKYKELRSKYLNAIDVAFKLGYEEGQKNAELEFSQQQMQQMQEQMAMMQGPPQVGGGETPVDENGQPLPPEEGGDEMLPPEAMGEEGMAEQSMDQGGDELGQSMDQLEEYVKNEKPDHATLLKSLHAQKNKEIPATENEKADKLAEIINKF